MGIVILVVEDQAAMRRSIAMGLELSGYGVVAALDGCEALAVLRKQPVDLILADIAMPKMNGYQLYEALRRDARWALVPFVFISARGLDSDIRFGKSLGADDYLVKPFVLEDLLAIVAGRLRRAAEVAQAVAAPQGHVGSSGLAPDEAPAPPAGAQPGAPPGVLEAGPLRIHPKQHRVWKDGREVELSPSEFAFLETLVRRPGEAVALTELCRITHGLETNHLEAGNLLYALVRSLRRKLGNPAGEMGCIESVRGIGYRLNVAAH
jgi:DNA-binding response OmpR family regulator